MTTPILVCAERLPSGLAHAPGVELVENLCTDPGRIREPAEGASGLVLVLHGGDFALPALQTEARSAGIDPLGLQILDAVTIAGDPQRLRVATAGARARAEAYSGSSPENAKPVFPEVMSRRELLTIPKPFYEAVPGIAADVCAAGDGCHACVDVCPQSAYRWTEGRVAFDKDACIPCGRCLTACPSAAITNPAVTPAQIRAQIEAMVAKAGSSIGVVFRCRRAAPLTPAAGWYEIEVPCGGMVPGTWLAAALLMGAGATTVNPCSSTGCPLGNDALVELNVAFGRQLVTTAGLGTNRIPPALEPLDVEPMTALPLEDPFGVHGPAEVVAGLAMVTTDGASIAFEHQGSPLGLIEVNPAACTMCGTCSHTCPTGALTSEYEEGRLTLAFDATRCTACRQCVSSCPELTRNAIAMRRAVDFQALRGGPVTLNESETLLCESCGKPIAASAMMDRIRTLLGDDSAATADYLSRRCMDCRGAW